MASRALARLKEMKGSEESGPRLLTSAVKFVTCVGRCQFIRDVRNSFFYTGDEA